jgi:gamma-glutamylputrescine oxidase
MKLTATPQVFWYLKRPLTTPARHPIKTDILIIGGGMAGLSAAQSFRAEGLSVVVLEKHYCGAGATGKSSGFITPDSELSLGNFVTAYGPEQAKLLWEFVLSGVANIERNIKQFDLNCDYQLQDSLVVATNHRAFITDIEKEHNTRHKLGYASMLYNTEQLPSFLGSTDYYGGVSYPGTFGINGYKYCVGMKKVLHDLGVHIYEETPVVKIHPNGVETSYSTVSADYIIVCADRYIPTLGHLTDEIYNAQTFLMVSAELTDAEIHALFPKQPFMVWDTDLIYQYYRIIGNNRLLLGGGSLWSTYASKENYHNYHVLKKLKAYFKKKFPQVTITFEYTWPGLIGITKDIMPIAGFDVTMPNVYYVGGAAGLPWAAALGNYSTQAIVHKRTNLDAYFSPYRKFSLGSGIQRILGTKVTFALSNAIRIYFS